MLQSPVLEAIFQSRFMFLYSYYPVLSFCLQQTLKGEFCSYYLQVSFPHSPLNPLKPSFLVKFTSDFHLARSYNHVSVLVLVDLSTAFNTVNTFSFLSLYYKRSSLGGAGSRISGTKFVRS